MKDRARPNEIRAAFRSALQERRTKTWKQETRPGGQRYDVVEPDWPSWRDIGGLDRERLLSLYRTEITTITDSDEAKAWRDELEAKNRIARERALATQRAAGQTEAQQRERATTRLRDWALENGSDRVELLIEENYPSWYEIAEDEFYTAHTPDGYTLLADGHLVHALPAPGAADIHTLRDARQTAAAAECLGEPELVWIGPIAGPGQRTGCPAVQLTIVGPHGERRVAWRPIQEGPSPAADTSQETLAAVEDGLDVDEPPPTLTEAIEEFRRLIDDLEDVRPDQMTTMFYIHAFNELTLSGRRLHELLESDPPT